MSKFDASILDETGTVMIDDRDLENHSGRTWVFSKPEDILTANTSAEVHTLLQSIDDSLKSGMFLAGYLGYEAGLDLDKPIAQRRGSSLPLAWFGVYRNFLSFDSEVLELGSEGSPQDIKNLRLNVEKNHHSDCIRKIKEYIASGDVYQVNYTCKLLFEHKRPARHLFARLRRAHPVGYSALINTGKVQIISISPELFLRCSENRILTRPMKGTCRRGRWFEEDTELANCLAVDIKNRAENVMILDLMRNDLGRVCIPGGVCVPRSFHIERYGTLFQMTSDVSGQLRDGTTISELVRTIFPPGSITGAPKIRAMEIINELEHEDRGVYCGCIGMFHPDGNAILNVAIRTIVQQEGHCEMGVGSGIVWDSDPDAELQEMLLKGQFVQREHTHFQLIETMLYKIGHGYQFLDEHLIRMRQSALYFGWPFQETRIADILAATASKVEAIAHGNARVRLLLSPDGDFQIGWTEQEAPTGEPARLLLSSRRTDPSDVFLYHKTTMRQAYNTDLCEAHKRGYFDLLYLNNRNELTEGAITNIIVEIDGKWYTPPLDCGLLPGTWRQSLLNTGMATERVLALDDLRRATCVCAGNSVCGKQEITLIDGCDLGLGIFKTFRQKHEDTHSISLE